MFWLILYILIILSFATPVGWITLVVILIIAITENQFTEPPSKGD